MSQRTAQRAVRLSHAALFCCVLSSHLPSAGAASSTPKGARVTGRAQQVLRAAGAQQVAARAGRDRAHELAEAARALQILP